MSPVCGKGRNDPWHTQSFRPGTFRSCSYRLRSYGVVTLPAPASVRRRGHPQRSGGCLLLCRNLKASAAPVQGAKVVSFIVPLTQSTALGFAKLQSTVSFDAAHLPKRFPLIASNTDRDFGKVSVTSPAFVA